MTWYLPSWDLLLTILCKYQLKPTQPEGTLLSMLVNLNRIHNKSPFSRTQTTRLLTGPRVPKLTSLNSSIEGMVKAGGLKVNNFEQVLSCRPLYEQTGWVADRQHTTENITFRKLRVVKLARFLHWWTDKEIKLIIYFLQLNVHHFHWKHWTWFAIMPTLSLFLLCKHD